MVFGIWATQVVVPFMLEGSSTGGVCKATGPITGRVKSICNYRSNPSEQHREVLCRAMQWPVWLSSLRRAALKQGPAACQQLLTPLWNAHHHLNVSELLEEEQP